MHSMPHGAGGYLEGSQARVFLQPNGTVVRKLKHLNSAAAMTNPQQLLALPQHPNVVRLLAIDGGDICMEAMAVSLQQHSAHIRQQPLPFAPKLHIARSVAQGLRHLHAHGMDHGDLCPANILLAWPACTHGETQVKLCDFYNARTGTARTAAYAAPEVVTSPPSIMCAADVWAFACCLLFLEGVQPFLGFDEDPAVYFYLGVHGCVAFREDGACIPFSLTDCAYAPARHIGQTAWADILAGAFRPEPRRLSSQQLCGKLHALHATHATHAPHAPHTPHATHTHTPPKNTHARPPLRRLNFK
jgi:serine/threonine protein kinase